MTTEDAWAAVEAHAVRLRDAHLRDLFASDPARASTLSADCSGLHIDFSKERLDAQALDALIFLARAAGVETMRDAMVAGAPINLTEGRAVLHMALRDGAGKRVLVDGADVMPEVHRVRDAMLEFADDLRSGRYATPDGSFTDVVNIGIGGSDLGPAMAVEALMPHANGPRVHFVSNVDGAHLDRVLAGLDARRTLVIIASKTFTTLETMTNAHSARAWLEAAVGERAGAHLAACSTNLEATRAFGIDDARVFGFWDWVGGRYSIWSAIGLPVALAIGGQAFRAFLEGAAEIDRHFREAPLAENLPVLLALIGVWRRNAMGWPSAGLMPYDQRLSRFPAYVQQLDMESNGKGVQRDGTPVARASGPIVWGEPGTNSQHSFFQLIHQGTDIVPVDFILAAEPDHQLAGHHEKLVANALAQASALAFGRSEAEVREEMAAKGAHADEIDRLAPHRTFPGNRPSTMMLFRRLDPAMLGRLIALFEHKVFVQGVIWNVNSFDQWGVELGKVLAGDLLPAVEGTGMPEGADASTAALLARYHALREG